MVALAGSCRSRSGPSSRISGWREWRCRRNTSAPCLAAAAEARLRKFSEEIGTYTIMSSCLSTFPCFAVRDAVGARARHVWRRQLRCVPADAISIRLCKETLSHAMCRRNMRGSRSVASQGAPKRFINNVTHVIYRWVVLSIGLYARMSAAATSAWGGAFAGG